MEGLCWLLAGLQVIIVSRFRRDIPLSNSRNVSLYGEEMNVDVSDRSCAGAGVWALESSMVVTNSGSPIEGV